VRVALRTTDCQPEESLAYGVNAVNDPLNPELFRIDPSLFIDHGISEKAGGNALIEGGVRKEITMRLRSTIWFAVATIVVAAADVPARQSETATVQRIDLAEQRGIGAGGSAEPLKALPAWPFQRLLEQRLDTDPPDAPFL